ncbi:uncharacterized protein Bfra_011656 [Botrytis fragariae]|uniref:Uncharacterized protein n=1 Tax=Botrytis fragariae TaxID=1964551 RepID=A0A8H6AKS0_9HELO|nr:uncharacterized protein Bfra_011656 [Botrytis fragariae]KAF5869113.1 hypothetical protein Bfra_011656 [Botrytis fragariae]
MTFWRIDILGLVASVILFNNIIVRTSPPLFVRKLHSLLVFGLIFWTEPPKSTSSVVIDHFNYSNLIEEVICNENFQGSMAAVQLRHLIED